MADNGILTKEESRQVEVCIHTILYIRQVYPADLFERRKKYETPVWRSRHPDLNEYISKLVMNVTEQTVQGLVTKVVLSIKEFRTDQVLENFVFDLVWFGVDDKGQIKIESAHIPLLLRSVLLKINNISSSLVDLPTDLTFTVFLELNDDEQVPLEPKDNQEETDPWVPSQPPFETNSSFVPPKNKQQQQQPQEGHKDKNNVPEIVPLRSTNLGFVNMQIFVEESPQKLEWKPDDSSLPHV